MPSSRYSLPSEDDLESLLENEIETDDEMDMSSDTSSEASSIENDPSIVHWYPMVDSTTDSNVSEQNQFWTPPSTMSGDQENETEVSTTFESPVRGRNVARRSRGRRFGVLYASRGRHRQSVTYVLTTILYRILTVNNNGKTILINECAP